ncbi:XF1762 family protein [Streptomyces mutabilis]|uniref:XF1762 family protein n=1 Tax=Streptomyces mutabilis TaxID=67332 RepID=UPI0019AAAD61|nr:XF1762 family protein [Streptomyces mutabilis]GGQ15275.1 hypothetical protein GCM10010279_23600 [Streptomyces mutabilis]
MSDAPLHLVPVRSCEAKDFVPARHRHHPPPTGQIFTVGATDETGTLRAVVAIGRPVARHLDDGATFRFARTAGDGASNAGSLLCGAAWRAAKALGYRRLITCTQDGGSGTSLRGTGWRVIADRPPRAGWHAPASGRDRVTRAAGSPLTSPRGRRRGRCGVRLRRRTADRPGDAESGQKAG